MRRPLACSFVVAFLAAVPAFAQTVQPNAAPNATATKADPAPGAPAPGGDASVPIVAVANAPARQKAIVALAVDRYIRPTYAAVADAAAGLKSITVRYCAQPTAANGEGVAAAYRTFVTAWAGADFLRFGPALVEHRLERMAFWPDPRNFVERQLRQILAAPDVDSFDIARLRGQSAAIQGLPAFERLMFDKDGKGTVHPDPDAATFGRKCRLASLVAANMSDIADTLRDEWAEEGGAAQQILLPGPNNAVYRTGAEAAQEIVKAITTGLEQTRDLAIRPALGAKPEDAKPRRFPYWLSGNTLPYLRASVDALRQIVETSGLADDLPDSEAWMRRSILLEIGNAANVLAKADASPEILATNPKERARLNYVMIALASARETIGGPLGATLGLKAGFNALDGD
ncbi:imelysin family protein [Segnochrobactrum spirostomi]|uniref:Imelysin family protein n=1 Tax=Segnochrobactrum spirostomi TaxID=2608987 RepID=A0A6A7Y551_9HYPH|nr:imelysin family protein [Segnochrobactrum spirostomi]MQT13845.1 imelysin family protein [Segnochrobactrum spirostomi]